MGEVSIQNLTKSYGNQTIIPSLDLSIGDGQFVSLLGPSGCGKTTILRMVAGLEDPDKGRINIGSETVYDSTDDFLVPPEKRGLGMVFQNYAIWPHMTVLENVAFPLRCQGMAKNERKNRALQALSNVRLERLASRKPHQLSGGQQQRVALARALVSHPKVLLLDEPLSNLDAVLREEMCDELLALREQYPVTMIYVTHDQKEAFKLSDQIALMNEGKIVCMGTPKTIGKQSDDAFVTRFLRH